MDPEPNQSREETKASSDSAARDPAASSAPATESAAGPSAADGATRSRSDAGSSGVRRKVSRTRPKAGTHPNNVKKLRQRAMMSKAELARRASVSPLTIDRVEAGCPCRMDTKRKILEALGLKPTAAKEVFPDVDLG